MIKQIILTICAVIEITQCGLFTNLYPRIKLGSTNTHDAGEPLLLTPFIKNGSIEIGQKLSKVSFTESLGLRSHAGFFTVKEQYNSNHYFWYFPAKNDNGHAPVVLWLQGGPGASSLFGLFMEIGPLIVSEDGISLRPIHWALNYHLIFIDNPVGAGFSYTSNDNGYCSDEQCVANDLYNSLQQFFQLFPHIQNNNFYISGESYAGKYIPMLAMKIHKENNNINNSRLKINLKGLAMGNAYCDPINQMNYGQYLYELGLLDNRQRRVFKLLEDKIKAEILKGDWGKANIMMDKLMAGELSGTSYFNLYTGYDNYYNYLKTNSTDIEKVFTEMLGKDSIRKAAHVGSLPFNSGEEVELHLAVDLLQSVAPVVEELLSHYKILLYNGQLDIIVAYPLTEEFVRNLNFSSANEYKMADRHIWKVEDDIAGYVKVAGNLTEIVIRAAGHMVPQDQPKWAYDMITRFIEGKRFW